MGMGVSSVLANDVGMCPDASFEILHTNKYERVGAERFRDFKGVWGIKKMSPFQMPEGPA